MSELTGHTSEGSSCPSLEQLRQFAGGQMPDTETHGISAHVQQCSHCSERILTLPETTGEAILFFDQEVPSGLYSMPTIAGEGIGVISSTGSQPTPVPGDYGRSPGLRLGRYRILKPIGRGGFGTVYQGHDEELDRFVAIKIPYSDQMPSLEQWSAYHNEARLHASLDHPHILPIYDIGKTEQISFFLVSKLIDGENLGDRIRRQPPSIGETVTLIQQIADALSHMHRRGLVHRDVKPRNILLDKDGTPYLADFGLAMRALPMDTTFGRQGRIIGTPAYMSPEQARGEGDFVDGRSDVYSLGVVLYEMLTGVKPFDQKSEALRQQILTQDPPSLRTLNKSVSPELEAICLRALAKDPAQRYQSVAEMAAVLKELQEKQQRRSERFRRQGAAMGLFGVGVIVVVLALLFNRGEKPILPPEPNVFKRVVTMATNPPGANISYIPLDLVTGIPQPKKLIRGTAGTNVELEPGNYLVVAVMPDDEQRFHEVYRYVPGKEDAVPGGPKHRFWHMAGDVVELPLVKIPPANVNLGMALVKGADEFEAGSKDLVLAGGKIVLAQPHRRNVPSFYMDVTEVTINAYWTRLFPGKKPNAASERLNDPMTSISWDQAVNFAEITGKRLPEEVEYEFAATFGGKRKFPWGDSPQPIMQDSWKIGPVGKPEFDVVEYPGQPPIRGLYSNAGEWTASWFTAYPGVTGNNGATLRIVRGAPFVVLDGSPLTGPMWGPRERLGAAFPTSYPGLGFRTVRSVKPRLQEKDFCVIKP